MSDTGGMGVAQRLVGVFTSPAKTFESIAARPGWDWLVPVFLVMIAFFIQQSVTLPKMDIDEAVRMQMKMVDKMGGGNMPEEQRATLEENARKSFEGSVSPGRRAMTTFFIFIPVLLVPLIYHGIAAALGGKTRYFTVLCGYAYTQAIYLVPQILTALVALPAKSLAVADVQYQRVLKSNPAAFMDFDTTNKAVLGLLSSIDPFDIWGFVVGSIALSKTTRLSKNQARAVVGGVWGLYILCKLILGAAYSGFMD